MPQEKLAATSAESDEVLVVPDRHLGGIGLGLWIARQFIEIMGGTISVASRVNEGSTFSVTLPVGGPPTRSGSENALRL